MAQDKATPGQHPTMGQAFVNVVKPPGEDVVYACPCCTEQTLSQRGAGEKCLLCYWCDDGQDDHDADVVRRTLNGEVSLTQARANFVAMGICREDLVPEQVQLPAASPVPVPRQRVSPRLLASAVVLVMLAGAGMWWRSWGTTATEPELPAASPKGQDTPEQTVGKFLSALGSGQKRPFMDCLTGPAQARERMERMFDASLVWDTFRQAVELAYGYREWEGVIRAARVRVLSRHWYRRRCDYARLRLEEARDDRAVVAVDFLALGTTTKVHLESSGGLWRIDAARPFLGGDDRDLLAARCALERLPGLQRKLGRKGFTARDLKEELTTVFADVAYLDGLSLRGARPRSGGGNPHVTIAVVHPTRGPAMYLIDDRTMSLEEAADLLADLVERQGPLDVQIRFDPRFPLDALTRLEEVCRAVGVAHTGLMPVLALPATAPSDRKE